jgi:hydroxyethylthiazole kinase
LKLIENIKFSVIKGNISEIKSLATDSKSSFGVDACDEDKVKESNIKEVIEFAKKLSKSTCSVIVITGEIDLIANEKSAIVVKNGDPMMSTITGSGCMLSSLITAFISANKDNIFEAAATAVICMGIAGERASESVRSNNLGSSSFRTHLIDEISKLQEGDIDVRGKYERF